VDGARDLKAILSSLTVSRREGTYVYVSESSVALPDAAATIQEDEGTTLVVERGEAERLGLRWTFASVWLTVEVHTSLDAVGVIAALAAALCEAEIPCNVLAGYYHDHFLVPVERADEAEAVLESIRQRASRTG
jgi:hypothetical protein